MQSMCKAKTFKYLKKKKLAEDQANEGSKWNLKN